MSLAAPQRQSRPAADTRGNSMQNIKMTDNSGHPRSNSTNKTERHVQYDSGTAVSRAVSAGANSVDSGGSGSSSTQGCGILCNAHEAPRRSSKGDSAFRTALKAAFIPQQPGKQMRTNGKPLGRTFHRTEPLPQKHAGAEVLKVDPRGADANFGDGVVLESLTSSSDVSLDSGADVSEKDSEEYCLAEETASSSGSNEALSPTFADEEQRRGTRGRSATTSTERSDTTSASTNSSVPCCIKFAPLPTSGRLKRANSITIGVAARSQLLHSQGAGRQSSQAQQWQAQQNQARARQQQQQQQPRTPLISATGSESVDLGDELHKGIKKAWSRVRRGSSVSSRGDEDTSSRERKPVKHDCVPEEDAAAAAGEKTPMRSHSPSDEAEGTNTPRRQSMQRRTSTGAFTGHASFMQIEEERKRALGWAEDADDDCGETERENEATRFIEMLGQKGGKPGHAANDDGARRGRRPRDSRKVIEVKMEGRCDSDAEEVCSNDGDNDEDDDEETREAERLADEALKSHNAQPVKVCGVEKMEKKRA